ncbi:hypothetical protein ABAC460_11285 [Asticcacaulis sp. AC460]|uniref:hypothetical protein n=1 Tax=Asticcacaulis sp. AC460 TaxID=1282360 RepID=UPI0003C3D73C|nr:hypothetical protein [Asticcacaulis sp. AC460]ESQ89877.1 hypothetical protein ABAC460_11285 [Asticcacaulis sp. AC460]
MTRSRTGFVAACVLVASLTLGACASSPEYPIETSAPREDGRGREQAGTERMRQSTEDNNDWGDAFTAPLEDFNLKRQDIPEILQNSVVRPYDLTGLDTCEAIASQVAQLDALLGRDFDEPPPPKDERTNTEKGKEFANKQAVGAVRGATRSIVPFRGAIRYLSGADKHQKQLDNAIQAGKVRRAYLKGVGMNKNCAPPAAPSWFKPRVYVETYVQPPKPEAIPTKKTTSKKRTSKKRR